MRLETKSAGAKGDSATSGHCNSIMIYAYDFLLVSLGLRGTIDEL